LSQSLFGGKYKKFKKMEKGGKEKDQHAIEKRTEI
jgi:hypothetical protein